MIDRDFTKIATQAILNAKALCEWGIQGGHTSADQLRFTIEARKEKARELVDAGMSQRQAAKVLGVNHKTIQNDLARESPKSGEKVATQGVVQLRPSQQEDDEPEQDDGDIEAEIEPDNYRPAFLIRADQAVHFAAYSGPIDKEILAAATVAAEAWSVLVQQLREKMNAN